MVISQPPVLTPHDFSSVAEVKADFKFYFYMSAAAFASQINNRSDSLSSSDSTQCCLQLKKKKKRKIMKTFLYQVEKHCKICHRAP